MVKFTLALSAVLLLAGCSSLSSAQSSCSEQSGFSEMWSCVKGRVAKGTAGDMNNDLGVRYLAHGDVIDDQYRAGKLTNSQARLLLAEELSRGNSQYEARKPRQVTANCHNFGYTTVCN